MKPIHRTEISLGLSVFKHALTFLLIVLAIVGVMLLPLALTLTDAEISAFVNSIFGV